MSIRMVAVNMTLNRNMHISVGQIIEFRGVESNFYICINM